MHNEILPECEGEFKHINQALTDIKEYLTNHIPSEIKDTRKAIWSLTLGIITALGGMVTALIIIISKGG